MYKFFAAVLLLISTATLAHNPLAREGGPFPSVTLAAPAVHAITLFEGGWIAHPYGSAYAAPQALVVGEMVHLRGVIARGGIGVAFTLPAGIKPEFAESFAINVSGRHGELYLYADGRVAITGVLDVFDNQIVSLSGVTFRKAP